MTIYSWNMLFRNATLDAAFAFVRNADADIFCLQEVPEEFLARLRELPYHLASVLETARVSRTGAREFHQLVILSRYPITDTQTVPLPVRETHFSRRATFFAWLMTYVGGWWHVRGERNALMVDVQTPDGAVRVYNLHLTLTNPQWRLEEFERALARHNKTIPTIVCGDFNILEKPHITLLNWMFDGRLSDLFHFRRERTTIEEHFAARVLTNPLRGKITHPLSRSQLDHILISDLFVLEKAVVLPNRYGSDHHPIRVQVT